MDDRISALARGIIYGFLLLVVFGWLLLGLWKFIELLGRLAM